MRRQLFIILCALFLVTLYGKTAGATSPGDLSYCGGDGQRACCVLEAIPSCDSDYVEKDSGSPQYCGDGITTTNGVCHSTHPDDKSFCGGDNQRACCLGEAFPSCDSGNVELAHTDGVCGDGATLPGADAGQCWTPTSCGAEGQRACTVTEQFPSCDSGLIEVSGCSDARKCGPSSGWCYKPTPCGAKGERACCALERTPSCDSGLTEAPGVSGDATCGYGFGDARSSGTCVDLTQITNNIAEPGTGWTSVPSTSCSLRGYADIHVHMFANLAHGGGVLAGAPYDPVNGINGALKEDFGTDLDLVAKDGTDLAAPSCDANLYPNCGSVVFHQGHGLFNETIGFGTQDGADSNFGAPVFSGWPKWTSTTHQQVYYKWLERAWRGGLRLMVQHAVTNEALCKSTKHLRNTDCSDDMTPIDAQIDAAYAFESWLDTQSGGPGQGWYRIVTTPADARQVIQDGKLAVVLGIETANLFNCKETGCTGKNAGETDDDYVKRKVDEYYDKGVRVIFPIHNFDNGYGAPATWQDMIEVGNRVSEGSWWSPENCPDIGYGFNLGSGFSVILKQIATLLFGIVEFPDAFVGPTSCNSKSLTPLGTTLITYMMQKGIIIDVDHMSNKSFDATLDLADSLQRPVIASHVQFFDLNQESIRHERMRTPQQLARIKATGGMIAAMLKDDQVDTDNKGEKLNAAYASPSGNVIADDCRNSSKTWAQMYQYAVDQMQGPVAFGSDFNGIAGHVGPRFGSDACGNDAGERSEQALANNRIQYPFTIAGFGTFDKQVTGLRTFDWNVDGFAHIGMYPDMIAELKQIGLTDANLDPLMNSASGFVDVWDRANGNSPSGGSFAQLGCQPVTVNADSTCHASGAQVNIADANTQTAFGPSLTQTPAAPYPQGITSVTLNAPPLDQCAAAPASCASTVTVVDTTGPAITCPNPGTTECAGAATPVMFNAPVVSADNCSSSNFAGCTAASGGGFPKGTTPVTCYSYDSSFNFGSCNFNVKVVDTTVPKITCPSDATAECTGNRSATVTPSTASGTDTCGTVNIPAHPPASFPVGTTPVTYTATDQAGLQASCTSHITVQDTTPPQISCPADKTAECTGSRAAVVTPSAAGGSDICGSVSIPTPPAASFPVGTSPVNYMATDQAGLHANCTSHITVQDTTPPQISCPADFFAECTGNRQAAVTPPAAGGSDVCGSVNIPTPAAFSLAVDTTAPIAYTATDQAGLQTGCTSHVTAQDTTPPQITCPADITVECTGSGGATVTPGTAVGSDICGSVSVSTYSTAQFPTGTTPLTYVATDQEALTSNCTSNIIVSDTTPPHISAVLSSPSVLPKHNHKMTPVKVQDLSKDVCDPEATCQITNVTSNEPVFGLGHGDQQPDWEITGPKLVNLRMERGSKGTGRVYTIELTCSDAGGNQSVSTTKVSVPK